MSNKTEETVKLCLKIEKNLSHLKLWANLVPKNSFFDNFRDIFPKDEWDIIRKLVYKRDKYKCRICGLEDIRLEAHEEWDYKYSNNIQILNNIISLCKFCHLNKHLGFAEVLVNKEKTLKYNIIQHWVWVNNEKEEHFNEYRNKVFELWRLKNKIKWKILNFNGEKLTTKLNLNELLQFLVEKN